MSAFERRTQIMDLVRVKQRVSTRDLSDRFEVSEVTIRQDLAQLERQGWIARVHGGAEATVRLHPEESHTARAGLNIESKRAIARAAAEMVADGDTVLLDSSTTAFQMTPFLAEKHRLTVITNHFHVASALSLQPSIQTILLGGTLRSETWSIVGGLAEDMLGKLHAAVGFLGTAGLTLQRGLTDADPREAGIKRAMAAAVDRVVVLADASKFGRQSLLETIPLDHVSHLITNAGAPADICAALIKRGIILQIV